MTIVRISEREQYDESNWDIIIDWERFKTRPASKAAQEWAKEYMRILEWDEKK